MPTPKVKTQRLLLPKHLIQSALDGRLTEHRVPVEPQPDEDCGGFILCDDGVTCMDYSSAIFGEPSNLDLRDEYVCPTPVGTLLWVAERMRVLSFGGSCAEVVYDADSDRRIVTDRGLRGVGTVKSPSMRKWHARLWFEVTAVRIEREGDKWEWVYTLNRVETER